MFKVEANVSGVEELHKKLTTMERKVAVGFIRKALRAGAKIMLAAVKATVPVKSGFLRSKLRVKAGKSRRGTVAIDVAVGDRWFQGREFYGAFQEFGWKSGSRKLGDKRKQNPGEHFMEYAFEENKAASASAVIKTMQTLIEQVESGVVQ